MFNNEFGLHHNEYYNMLILFRGTDNDLGIDHILIYTRNPYNYVISLVFCFQKLKFGLMCSIFRVVVKIVFVQHLSELKRTAREQSNQCVLST